MKEQNKSRTFVFGSMEDRIQTISQAKLNKATAILRDKLYKDKMKAAITEPLCNAIDEHRKNGVTRPVDVILTQEEIIIRDYGKGLDDETAFNVFFQYLESTKTDTDEQIGGFGLGAKAPGAYAQVYSVVSYYNGKKTIFWSRVDGDVNVVSKVASIDTDAPSGIAVHIPWAVSHTAETEVEAKSYVQREIWNAWNLLHDLYVFVGYGNKPEFRVISSIVITEYEDRSYYTSSSICKWKLDSLYSNEIVEDVDTNELNDVTADNAEWHFHRLTFMSASEDEFDKNADAWYPGEREKDLYGAYIIYSENRAFLFNGKRIKTFARSFIHLRYHMFSDIKGLYDGDMLYPVIENTASTRPLLSILSGYATIIKVDRSEICINQSRESASLTSENVDKIVEDLKQDVVDICDRFTEHIREKLKYADVPTKLYDIVKSKGALNSILDLSELLSNRLGIQSRYYNFFKLVKRCSNNSYFLSGQGNLSSSVAFKTVTTVKSKSTWQYSFVLRAIQPSYDDIDKLVVIRNSDGLAHAARFQDFLEEVNSLLGENKYIIDDKSLKTILEHHQLFLAAKELGYDLSITKYNEDLEKLIDSYKSHKISRKVKVKEEITELRDLLSNSEVIKEEDYKETLIISASDFKSNNNIFGKWFKYASSRKEFFDIMLKQLGYNHLATCRVADMKKFLDAGCTKYDKSMNPKILDCVTHMVHRYDIGFIKTIANRLDCEDGFAHMLIPKDWVMMSSVHAIWVISFLCEDEAKAKKLTDEMYKREEQLTKAQRDAVDHSDEFYDSLDENELYYINSTSFVSPRIGKKSSDTYRKYENKMKAAIKVKFENFLSRFIIKSGK